VVVVVVGDLFTELVMRVLVTHRDLADEAGVLEYGEIAVDGALGERRLPPEDRGNRDRATCILERTQEELSARREPLPVLAETMECDVVDLCHRWSS
jgi:hypothetical protein